MADFSKRTFLQVSGAALGASALSPALAAGGSWDLIIMGGGTAGLPAAIFAANRGGRVLIVEKGERLGGTLDRAAGQIAGAGTRFQKAAGIVDSPQAHYDDIMRICRGTADPALIRLFVDNAGPAIDWLADNGLTIMPGQPIKGDAGEPFTTARYLWGPEGGRSILKILKAKTAETMAAGRVTALMRTRVVELMQDGAGAVTGVVVEDEAGRRAEHRGRSVLLAAGGCASNPTLFQDLHKTPLYARWAHPNSQGQGITLGVAAGGFVRGGDKYLPDFGRILLDANYPAPVFASAATDPRKRPPWEIFVNRAGERFVAEDAASPDRREHALAAQPGHRFWVVFDQAMLDRAPPLTPTLHAEALASAFAYHPMFAKAGALEALAVQAGIDAAGLSRSVAGYNAAVAGGPDALGRRYMPLPVAKGPFYAICQQGSTLISYAGLGVDGQLRVIRQDGRPIPNLYAAGEVLGAGATSGNAHTSGMMAGAALTFGYVLGRSLPVSS